MSIKFTRRTAGGLFALTAAAALFQSPAALAGPAVGIDPTGSGTDFFYADVWSHLRDSALALDYDPNGAVPYDVGVTAQVAVSGFTLNGGPATGGNILNPDGNFNCDVLVCYQVTKVIKFREEVQSITNTFNSSGDLIQNATFGLGAQIDDVDDSTDGNQQLAIYLNRITGSGSVTFDPTDATGYQDGILILSGSIVSNVGSFSFNVDTGIGSGSVNDVSFDIDYVNANYLDIATAGIVRDTFQGSTNFPSFYTPTAMWDGTSTAGGLLFTVDSSQDFAAVPAPAPIALLGLGLAGLASVRRLRRATGASR